MAVAGLEEDLCATECQRIPVFIPHKPKEAMRVGRGERLEESGD